MSTKPKTWAGKPTAKPKRARKAKAQQPVFEKIPDEADDQPEQTTLAESQPAE